MLAENRSDCVKSLLRQTSDEKHSYSLCLRCIGMTIKKRGLLTAWKKSKVLPGCLKMEHVPEKNHVPKYV